MKNKLENEVIYITGASAGIGYATAELCLAYGATVVITGRNKENLNKAEIFARQQNWDIRYKTWLDMVQIKSPQNSKLHNDLYSYWSRCW